MTRLNDYLATATVLIDYARRRSLDYIDVLTDDRWRQIWPAHRRPARRDQFSWTRGAILCAKLTALPTADSLATLLADAQPISSRGPFNVPPVPVLAPTLLKD